MEYKEPLIIILSFVILIAYGITLVFIFNCNRLNIVRDHIIACMDPISIGCVYNKVKDCAKKDIHD